MGAEAGPYTRLYKRVNHFFVSSIMRGRRGLAPGCALHAAAVPSFGTFARARLFPSRTHPGGRGGGAAPLWPTAPMAASAGSPNQDSSINVDNKTTRRPCAYNQPNALRLHLSSCLRKGVDCAAQRLWQRWRAAISKQGTVQASLRSPRRRCQIPVPAPRPRRGWTRRAA